MAFFFDDFGDQVDTFYTLLQDVFENFTEIFSTYINRLSRIGAAIEPLVSIFSGALTPVI